MRPSGRVAKPVDHGHEYELPQGNRHAVHGRGQAYRQQPFHSVVVWNQLLPFDF